MTLNDLLTLMLIFVCRTIRSAHTQLSITIQLLDNFNKHVWRKLAEDADYPAQFYCSDMSLTGAEVDCDTLEDDVSVEEHVTKEDNTSEVMI